MKSDLVIKTAGTSKKFCKNLKHVMVYGAQDIARDFVGINANTTSLRSGEFWAVDDISFDLKQGETLGIIGPNGSGKSTILKMLNGIYMPDRGKIKIQGRVGALIEVGAGFHPMLTGRENIYINGSILGMSKKEIDTKFDAIVKFAEIGDFIDAPVKHYSSGMFVRLGFSIAVHVEPEILLVDEILSVGDFAFIIKSLERMKKLRDQGTTVVFVSHNLDQVARFCSRALVLEKGQIRYDGDPHEALRRYRNAVVSSIDLAGGSLYPNVKASNDVTIEKILIQSHAKNNGDPIVEYRKALRIAIELATHNPPKEIHCHLKFRQIETGFECAATTKDNRTLIVDKHTSIVAEIDQLPLTAGIYIVEAYITDPEHIVDYAEYRGEEFEVTSDNGLGQQFGINVIAANWSVHEV